ncbi:MAG: 3-hydroxyisobutyrate dehydrogenase [Thiotrichales bacterium]|nr:3-hydroxyisobutyrate dehydrogenase [Thiotrichales bacterium]
MTLEEVQRAGRAVETAKRVAGAASDTGVQMLDAPVSGGPEGVASATLSFMVGGPETAFHKACPILDVMGKRVLHFGPAGSGQAAKACHNMICGITSLAVRESFALAERLGLDARQFYELCAGAAAQSWILENRCPVPGVADNTPASNSYRPGFAAGLMAKDLRLAQQAASACGQTTPFGAAATERFSAFAVGDDAGLDFSAVYRTLDNQ